jgi:hypothetical protein
MNRYVGNLPPMPGVFQDYPAPVVRNVGAERIADIIRSVHRRQRAHVRFCARNGLKSDIAPSLLCAHNRTHASQQA